MSIVVENISKSYGKQYALKNVSFEIKPDEIVGFIGPNGAGKSTMMKIICGYIPASAGNVFVNGLNVRDHSVEVRKAIGYLAESNPLYYEMYIQEYFEFVAGIYKIKDKTNRIKEIISQTGLEKEKKKKIGALSKGYKQRVGIGQALIHDPSVVILDEPTSGLDPNQIIEIRNLISLSGKSKTIMLSTHIMQEVEAICNRIIIINNGEIVANDETAKIATHSSDKYFTVKVEFEKAIELDQLEKIEGVTKAVFLEGTNYLLQSHSDVDIRAHIFRFAVDKGLTVLSLQKIEKSLEEVFHELTAGK